MMRPATDRSVAMLLVLATMVLVAGLSTIPPRISHSELRMDFDLFHRQMEERFGSRRADVSRQWEQMLQDAAGRSELEQAQLVSRFFHRHLRYESDQRIWGEDDYWATPLETLGMGRGDCEDWAIAKYFSLRILGITDQRLRLIYSSARLNTARGTVTEPHMVLGYYPDPTADPLILDNLSPNVLPATQRPDLTPVFSFNSEGLWTGIKATSSGGSSTSLSRWRQVLERVREEGATW